MVPAPTATEVATVICLSRAADRQRSCLDPSAPGDIRDTKFGRQGCGGWKIDLCIDRHQDGGGLLMSRRAEIGQVDFRSSRVCFLGALRHLFRQSKKRFRFSTVRR